MQRINDLQISSRLACREKTQRAQNNLRIFEVFYPERDVVSSHCSRLRSFPAMGEGESFLQMLGVDGFDGFDNFSKPNGRPGSLMRRQHGAIFLFP